MCGLLCRDELSGNRNRPPLRARDFMASNPEHLDILKKMGVSLIHLKDGRVQLVQHANQVSMLCIFLLRIYPEHVGKLQHLY